MRKHWFETHRNFGFGDGEIKKFKSYAAAKRYAKKVGGRVRLLKVWKDLEIKCVEMTL